MTAEACPDWRHLAEEARDEEDPERLMLLIEELNRVLAARADSLNPQLTKAKD
jgi:hypothetical protein